MDETWIVGLVESVTPALMWTAACLETKMQALSARLRGLAWAKLARSNCGLGQVKECA